MKFLPVFLNITEKKILFVGAGKTACHKLGGVLRFTDNVTVLGKEISPEMSKFSGKVIKKIYEPADLEGHSLVYACTDDEAMNRRIKKDGEKRGILVNVCDNAEECDFISPAVFQKGNITVAVSSHARDVKKAVQVRNAVQEMLENDQV